MAAAYASGPPLKTGNTAARPELAGIFRRNSPRHRAGRSLQRAASKSQPASRAINSQSIGCVA